MFNSEGGYSLADIAAATGNGIGNDGFFGGSGWWIILLFLFAWGGWGNGVGVTVMPEQQQSMDLIPLQVQEMDSMT